MGVLSEPRLELLAQGLARGKTVIEASQAAGYKPGSSFASNARKRANRKDVKARVLELQTVSGVVAAADSASLQRKLLEIIDVPLVPDDVRTADRIAAMTLLAKIIGAMAPEKHDHTLTGLGERLDRAIQRIGGK